MSFEEEIEQYCFQRHPVELYAPIRYALLSGGKHLRYRLTLLAYQLYGGKDNNVIDKVAAALEVFHNFTLVHDDVMDHSLLRRGQLTVQAKWNAETAILSGDRMLLLAYEFLLNSAIHAADLIHCLKCFTRMASELCEGQQMDADLELTDKVSYNDYMQMVSKKTAVLLATALQIGSFLSNRSTIEEQQLLYTIGMNVGVAFQIQDDLLDVFGKEGELGKPIGGDIVHNKKTYPLLIAQREADATTNDLLSTALKDNADDATKIKKVTDIYNQLHIFEIGQAELNNRYVQIKQDIAHLPDNRYREELMAIVDFLMKRKY